jgi:fumarate hydratase class I
MATFKYQNPLPLAQETTTYRLLTKEHVSIEKVGGAEILKINPKALTLLAKQALYDESFFLRTNHLKQLRHIVDDPEASDNDRYVAMSLLKNAVISAKGVLPMCQDTGTALVFAQKGEKVWTGGGDEEALSQGIFEVYQERNLRYSQMVPLSMFEEKNSGTNLPAQIDIYATRGNEYHFLFIAKGGGSANKFYLYQETKALLNEKSLDRFLFEKLFLLGTAACPPYHISVVIGGSSAESCLKTCKLASTGYYDTLPTQGNDLGQAFRDLEWEKRVNLMAQRTGIGAQFGGKYLAHDIRVIRLPRHAASCPVSIGVSCSADRNIKGKITREGIFLEQMEFHPEQFVPDEKTLQWAKPIQIDLNRPMEEVVKELSKYPVKTRVNLTGSLIVARDIAHAKLKEMLDRGQPLPEYFKKHPIYYAGPAKTPQGLPSGSFGPTTAGRMDQYVAELMKHGGSRIMLAKGNRSPQVTQACKEYKGFYLGSIGGPAAILAKENILKMEVVAFEELGMEAIRRIEVKDFPAFIVTDDKGNDFFQHLANEKNIHKSSQENDE